MAFDVVFRAMEANIQNPRDDKPAHGHGPDRQAEVSQKEVNLSHESIQSSTDTLERTRILAEVGRCRKDSHTRVLFRGSFNPVHDGHLSVVREMFDRGYTTVLMDPVSTSPGKGSIPTDKAIRAEMIIAALEAEGIPVAATPDAPGVYVCASRSASRKALRDAVLSKTDFAMGADNDETYSEHMRWRMFKRLGGDRLAIVDNKTNVHSSDIRRGDSPPHPATVAIIDKYQLYPERNAITTGAGLARFQEAIVLYNPISGAGAGKTIAQEIASEFKAKGLTVSLQATAARYDVGELEALFQGKDIAIVVGGDGTMMGTLEALSSTATPVYMIPAGNESLFAKKFKMEKGVDALLSRMEHGTIEEHYHAEIDGKPFFLMCSVGFDSSVVEEIGERSGPSSDWMYAKGGVRALLKYKTPVVTLTVDGEKVLDKQKGYLIIGNTDSYGRDLKLVPEANSKDGELCVRFFPQSGILPELNKIVRMMFRKPVNLNGARLFTGKDIELSVSNGPYAMQADGDLIARVSDKSVHISISESPIRIIEEADKE